MSDTMPNCTKCGDAYSIPASYDSNIGLCTKCRPIKVCEACNGSGQQVSSWTKNTKYGPRPVRQVLTCLICDGTRHEPAVRLSCLYCGKPRWFAESSSTGSGVFNFFCDGECEDRYAARL